MCTCGQASQCFGCMSNRVYSDVQSNQSGAGPEAGRADATLISPTHRKHRAHLLYILHHLRHPRSPGIYRDAGWEHKDC